METRFTKGPWPVERTGDGKRYIVGKGLIEGPNGYDVAEVYSDDCDHEEAEANAHLIASAPTLYAKVAIASAIFREYERLHRQKGTPDGNRKADRNAQYAVEMEDTLAKARGES